MKDLENIKDEFEEIFDAEMFDEEGGLHLPELTLEQADGLKPDPELIALMERERKAAV